MLVTNKIKIDITRQELPPRLDAMQNDANARAVEISLLENGLAWTIPDGVSATISYVKPDGTSGLYDQLPGGGNATDIGDSTIKFILAPQMLTVPGLVRASVVLIKDATQISTFPMHIDVTAQPGAGAEGSENYYRYTTLADLNNAVGNLDDLETKDKSSLVAAINEVAKTGGSDSGQNVTLTTEQITALDNMFKVCAFSKDDVSAEYNAFKTAFGITDAGGEEEPDEPVTPEVTLTSISATYNGGDVTVGTAVTDLTGIEVTAHYSDDTSEVVTGYTLSGTIAEGSNTITVSYGGKTATFTVTGVAESGGETETEVLSKFQWKASGWPKRVDNGDGSSTMDWTSGGQTVYNELPPNTSNAYWTMISPGKISGGRLDIKFHKSVTSGSIGVCVYAVNADATLGYQATTSGFEWTASFASANTKEVSTDTSLEMPDGLYPYILVRNTKSLMMDGDTTSDSLVLANHIVNGDITFEVTG